MGNLNKKSIIDKAEQILARCEEKYKEEKNNKRKVRELENKCRKLKKYNLIWKILLAISIIGLLIVAI